MLAGVLMRTIAWTGVVLVPARAVVAFLWGGFAGAVGFLAGGFLALASGVGLVGLASRLLSGGHTPGVGPGAAGALMAMKLVAVLGIAWTLLAVVRVDGIGFLFGLGAGVLCVVIGAQLGQGSPEGQAAIRAEERRIADAAEEGREEGEDSGAKSG